MNQRPRYLIVPESEPRLSKFARILLYFVMFLLALLYFAGFAYYATEPDPFLDPQIESK